MDAVVVMEIEWGIVTALGEKAAATKRWALLSDDAWLQKYSRHYIIA